VIYLIMAALVPSRQPRQEFLKMKVGKESVVYGNVPTDLDVGDQSVVVGATDAHGNVRIGGGTAVGHGSYADSTSVAIGKGAGAGSRPDKKP
jgi:hypothetical protein